MSAWFEHNIDYLLYTGGCALVFALLELWLRRRRPAGHLPAWTWPALAALLGAGWFFVGRAGDAEHARIRGFLEGIAPTYALEIERLGHARLTLATPPDDPVYLGLIEALKRWKEANRVVSDIYTFREVGGVVRLIVDAETDYDRDGKIAGEREQRVPIGKEYPQADDGMRAALAGTSSFSPEPVRDEWGVWVSAQVPLRDATGRIEGAVGVDYPADAWLTAIALGRQRMLWFLGIPVLILGFGAAITGALRAELGARRAIEFRLRESEAQLRTAIDNLPCDFWMMDRSERYTMLNAASRAHWGDNIGRGLDELQVAQVTRAEWREINRRAFAGETVRHEVAYELRGRRHHYSSIVAPVRVDGEVGAILGVNFDITDRVEGEAKLRKSEEKLALHVRHTPLAVIEFDLACQVRAWNPSAERIFGYTAAEAIGRPAAGLIVPESARAHVERLWAALLTHKGGTRSTNENVTKSGRAILCEWYNTPLVDATGAVIGVASSAQDITERDALEKQLRQAQKMESIGQLAGGVAHEFNNLLTPMLVQTDLIAFHYAEDVKLLAYLRPVQEAIEQAAQLNQRILAVGRRTSEQRELLALNALVENALELLRPSLDRRIEVSLSLAAELPLLLLDRPSIVQIVMNLCLNARDTLLEKLAAGAPRGWVPRLAISTERASTADRSDGASAAPFATPCQRLRVVDNGCGIPPGDRAKVFEPFFTTKAPGHGTGLGLAVVWNAVRSLGGWVEVAAGDGGEGSAFSVFLPVPEAPPVALTGAAPLPPKIAFKRTTHAPLEVLLAEDTALVSATIVALLGVAGHNVTAASDGEEAWELFARRGEDFDVLLTDYNMPRLNGGDLIQRVKAAGFAGRIVLVSGYLTMEKLEELKKLGAHAVLRKPFTPAHLLAAIEG